MHYNCTKLLQNVKPSTPKAFSRPFPKFSGVYPKYHQHVLCPTEGNYMLTHCYTPHKGAYCTLSQPRLGQSDHTSKTDTKTVSHAIKCWTHEEHLQDCFGSVDWDIFRESSTDLQQLSWTSFRNIQTSVCSLNYFVHFPTRNCGSLQISGN